MILFMSDSAQTKFVLDSLVHYWLAVSKSIRRNHGDVSLRSNNLLCLHSLGADTLCSMQPRHSHNCSPWKSRFIHSGVRLVATDAWMVCMVDGFFCQYYLRSFWM